VVAVSLKKKCGGVPFLRGRVKGPLSWALVAALSALVYTIGYGAGLVLIG
jgi:hypothetical protein